MSVENEPMMMRTLSTLVLLMLWLQRLKASGMEAHGHLESADGSHEKIFAEDEDGERILLGLENGVIHCFPTGLCCPHFARCIRNGLYCNYKKIYAPADPCGSLLTKNSASSLRISDEEGGVGHGGP